MLSASATNSTKDIKKLNYMLAGQGKQLLGYNTMKNRLLLVSAVIAVITSITHSLIAAPIGHSNLGREYISGAHDTGAWSLGIYAVNLERDVAASWFPVVPMKSEKIMGYLGYDILPWLTTYAIGGTSQTRISWGQDPGSKPEYGFGLIFNIIDTEILDPTLMEDRLRLNANIQYTFGQTTLVTGPDIEWTDLSGSLTLGLVNDLDGHKFFVPNSMELYFGPAFSDLTSSSLDEKDAFGLTAGLVVYLDEKISLDLAYTSFDKAFYSFGVNVRF